MSNELRIRYVPLADTTPEKEMDALAVVYKFILDRHAEKQDPDRDAQLHTRKEVKMSP